MSKTNSNEEAIRNSVSSIYSDLLNRRKSEKEQKLEQKRMEKELKEQEKESKGLNDDGTKMSRKERRQAELDNWKEIVIGLTGDDLEYSSKKKNKKKYKKWIDDEDTNMVLDAKQKKPKKRNYKKEFEPELNMLRALVAEQNRFTSDLQKRFQYAAGPATKDGMAPNKTMVELASAITSGRSNSLGMLREIGSLKKTIADLYMKQKKLDSDLSGNVSMDTTDMGLMGSSIAQSLFGDNPYIQPEMMQPVQQPISQPVSQPIQPVQQPVQQPVTNSFDGMNIPQFDPDSWEGPSLSTEFIQYENIPKRIIVKKDSSTGDMRFAAIREDNGEELVGANIPTSDPRYLKVNESDMTVKGEFDEVYPLVIE